VACKDSSAPNEPGAATKVAVQSGNGQGANSGTAVPEPLAVLVTDADEAPVAGVTVNFVVKTGGGSITGGTAQTGANGIATAGTWTLGSVLGANTVEASVSGLPAVTFTATARCSSGGALAAGASLSGILTTSDCKYSGGELTDWYTYTTTVQQAVRFYQTSQLLDTYLEIYDAAGQLLAANDDSAGIAGHPTSTVKMLLAPGTYHVAPSSFASGETGAYSVSAASAPESENACEVVNNNIRTYVFATPGVTTVGELTTGDCTTGGTSPFLFETIGIVMRAGRTYVITMNSTAFDAYLELGVLNGARVAFNDNTSGTNARITFTPTSSNFYVIVPSSAATGATGAYTLIIE
jgi:hypothetical protein